MEENVRNFLIGFLSIVYEALPFVVLGAVIAGILEELVPQQLLKRIMPRRRSLAIGIGALLGLVFPMCECGIVVVMRRLLRKGLPLSCCVAYMLAGPIINLVVIGSTFVAFKNHINGMGLVVLRPLMGFVVAYVTALVVEGLYRKHGDNLLNPSIFKAKGDAVVNNENGPRPSPLQRVGNIAETALHDFVDITVFLILGALLAALVGQVLSKQDIALLSQQYAVLVILLMMGLALLLSLCSEADAFVAASFTTLSPAAKLSFLVLGPMMDIKLYLMYTRIFRPRLIWTIITSVIVQVFVYSMLVHIAWQSGWLDVPLTFLQNLVGGPTSAGSGGP